MRVLFRVDRHAVEKNRVGGARGVLQLYAGIGGQAGIRPCGRAQAQQHCAGKQGRCCPAEQFLQFHKGPPFLPCGEGIPPPVTFQPEYTRKPCQTKATLREMPRNLRETQKVWLFVQLHNALLQMGAGHHAENSI